MGVIVMTGGSRGIGASTAHYLAQNVEVAGGYNLSVQERLQCLITYSFA